MISALVVVRQATAARETAFLSYEESLRQGLGLCADDDGDRLFDCAHQDP